MGSPDVVVVGAGVIGAAAALRLQQRGARVTVLDAGALGGRASRAAAGMLAAQSEAEEPGPLFDLARRSLGLYPALSEELRASTGQDIGFRRSGVIDLAFDDEAAARLEGRRRWQRALDLPVDRLDGPGLRAIEPVLATEALGGLHFPGDGQVEPRALVRALLRAAALHGALLRAGAPVVRLLVERDRVQGVELPAERLACASVVLAAGAWSSRIAGTGLRAGAVEPVRGQIVELEQPPDGLRSIVRSSQGYCVPRPDGRVLCGSTMERAGDDESTTAEGVLGILRVAVAMVPSLAPARLRGAWAGLRPTPSDGRLLLGRSPIDGLVLASGHHRSGILLAPVTAEVVAALVLDGASPIDLSPFADAS